MRGKKCIVIVSENAVNSAIGVNVRRENGYGRLRKREKSGDELKREVLKILSNSLQNKQKTPQEQNPYRTSQIAK